MSARSTNPSMASRTSLRKVSAAIWLRSKYQRNASRNSRSTSGKTYTENRVTLRSCAHGPQTKEHLARRQHEDLPGDATILRAKLSAPISRRWPPSCQSTLQPQRTAPRRKGGGRPKEGGQYEHSCDKAYHSSHQKRGLSTCSSGAPRAGRQARSGSARFIFTNSGLAPYRYCPLSSNLRQHRTGRCYYFKHD